MTPFSAFATTHWQYGPESLVRYNGSAAFEIQGENAAGFSSGAAMDKMEKLADMLNQGQLRQTQITVEGTKLFDNVTGKANLKQMERFAGPGAELVDIGLTGAKGTAVPLTMGSCAACTCTCRTRTAGSTCSTAA